MGIALYSRHSFMSAMFTTWMWWTSRAFDLPNLFSYWWGKTHNQRKYRDTHYSIILTEILTIHSRIVSLVSFIDVVYNISKCVCLPQFLFKQIVFGAVSVIIILIFKLTNYYLDTWLGYFEAHYFLSPQLKWKIFLLPLDIFKRTWKCYLWYFQVSWTAFTAHLWSNTISYWRGHGLILDSNFVTCRVYVFRHLI